MLVSKVKSRNQDRDHALPVSYVRMICREGYIPPPTPEYIGGSRVFDSKVIYDMIQNEVSNLEETKFSKYQTVMAFLYLLVVH